MTFEIAPEPGFGGGIRLPTTTADGQHHIVVQGSRRGMAALRAVLHSCPVAGTLSHRVDPAALVPLPVGEMAESLTTEQSAVALFLSLPDTQNHRLPVTLVQLLSMPEPDYIYYLEIRAQERASNAADDVPRADFMKASAQELMAASPPARTADLLDRLPQRAPEVYAVAHALSTSLAVHIADWPSWMDANWGITDTSLVVQTLRESVYEGHYAFQVNGNAVPLLVALAALHRSLTLTYYRPDGTALSFGAMSDSVLKGDAEHAAQDLSAEA